MVYDYFDKFTFNCEMYDEEADTIRELVLNFFPFDNSVQVMDTGRNTVLLRRSGLPTLKLEMLQIGNIVNVFSKLLLVVDCPPLTKRTLFRNVESTFALIKPMPPSDYGKVITYMVKKGFRIVQMKLGRIDKDFASVLYKSIEGNSLMPIIIDYVTTGDVVGLELVRADAVKEWRACLGATDPAEAEPGTLRSLYGQNKLRNVAHGCNTPGEVKHILDLFFGHQSNGKPRVRCRATLENCTCCLIKPHALLDGNLGSIIELIGEGNKFYISGMAMFSVKVAYAEEFFEVYKGVLPEYEAMALHLAEGKCVALEIKCFDPKLNVVCEFRKLCGPRDPEVCRQLYPETIRARYGKNMVHNAVHCTDLPEDGVAEVQYFFQLLASQQ